MRGISPLAIADLRRRFRMLGLIFKIPDGAANAVPSSSVGPCGAGNLPAEHPIRQLGNEIGDAANATLPCGDTPAEASPRPCLLAQGREAPATDNTCDRPRSRGATPVSFKQAS
eukprot:6195787-Heterocapsa_arctica.AAC.1